MHLSGYRYPLTAIRSEECQIINSIHSFMGKIVAWQVTGNLGM